VTSSRIKPSQVQSSPVKSCPVQSSPVQSSPVQSSPVQSSPVQSSPVQSSQCQVKPSQVKSSQGHRRVTSKRRRSWPNRSLAAFVFRPSIPSYTAVCSGSLPCSVRCSSSPPKPAAACCQAASSTSAQHHAPQATCTDFTHHESCQVCSLPHQHCCYRQQKIGSLVRT